MKQGVFRKVISLVAVLIMSVGLMTGCEERSNVPINPITGERDILDFDLEAIKINGEVDKTTEYAENNFVMKRKDNFPGWEAWKEESKKGFECEVHLERRGNRIITTSENLGVHIENTTIMNESPQKVYVALTGDRCALTDIRIKAI